MRLLYSAKAVVRKRNKPSFEEELLPATAVVPCAEGERWTRFGEYVGWSRDNGGEIFENLPRFLENLPRFWKISHVFGETSEIISFLSDLFLNLLSKSSRGKKWQMEDEMFSFVKNARLGASRAHARTRITRVLHFLLSQPSQKSL